MIMSQQHNDLLIATKWPCHHRIIILSAVDKLPMTIGLKVLLVQTAG